MKNVCHKKIWNSDVIQPHVDTPPNNLIKSKNDNKSSNYLVKLKLCRYPTSYFSDLYEFKMSLFDNGEME